MSQGESVEVTSDLPPFAAIPRWLETAMVPPDPDDKDGEPRPLSDRAYRLFGVLTGLVRRRIPPDQDELRGVLGCSESSLRRALRELEKVGAVQVEERRNRHGERIRNRYHLTYRPPHGCAHVQHTSDTRDDAAQVAPVEQGEGSRVPPVSPSTGHTRPVDHRSHVAPPVTGDAHHRSPVTGVGDTGFGETNPRAGAREANADAVRRHPSSGGGGSASPPGGWSAALERLAAALPADARPLERDRRLPELRRLVAQLLDAGWTTSELVEACAGPPAALLYPAAWMCKRLAPLADREPPRAAQAARAAATAEALAQLDAVERTPRPPDLDLPAFLVGVTGPGRPDDPDRSREGG